MPEVLAPLFDTFVADARTTLVVPGASAELSVTGKLDNFLVAALVCRVRNSLDKL